MIKTIQNTSFPNLLELRLGDNTIASIELLCAIDMPNIKTLLLSITFFYIFLDDNPISELRALSKCNLPNL